MISFRTVSKRYQNHPATDAPALDQVSFDVGAGEVFGYIGPNGAGKTTTIKILVGLIREYDGSVEIDGVRDGSGARNPGFHRYVGYMPQSSGFQTWRTVYHTLQTFGRLSGLESPSLETAIEQTLERVELTEYRKTRLTHLSGGTLQRLRLAQAILHEPKVLVLDEPMTGLDPASRFRFKQIIRDLADEHRVVLFSSHILSDVEDLATRIGVIAGGKIKRIGTPDELRSEYSLRPIIEIETKQGFRAEPEPFGSIAGVEETTRENDHLIRVHVDRNLDLDEVIRRVLETCLSTSMPVRRISHHRPSLEEVYLRLTRDSQPEGAQK